MSSLQSVDSHEEYTSGHQHQEHLRRLGNATAQIHLLRHTGRGRRLAAAVTTSPKHRRQAHHSDRAAVEGAGGAGRQRRCMTLPHPARALPRNNPDTGVKRTRTNNLSICTGLPSSTLTDHPPRQSRASSQYYNPERCRPGYPEGSDRFRVVPFVAVRLPCFNRVHVLYLHCFH